MGWLGKVVGGTIGFALGGPIGAVAGAAFGHGFDKKEERYLSRGGVLSSGLSSDEQAQMTFFVAAFSMLAKLAKADGRVTDSEIASIETFMTRDLNLDVDGRNSAVNIFRQALNSPESFDAFALQFYRVFRVQPRIIEFMMDVLFRVSAADGAISAQEEVLLQSAGRIFQIHAAEYEKIKARYVKTVNKAYAVLKCDETATNEELKKSYRKLVAEYHPDKIASKGLPEEFTALAGDKFREIQEAWESIKAERGI
ncbi:DnaJ like chaperone protein [Desulfocicer vacuolatum DSM 3385]|uniref:DnaJ like chaperone protein n=1 Tax=Desulfocicer vacuolatum DSM 3385 TaxID=1121400 RepID=A0A1W2E2K6_9BACT|nr:TerB family tellurite resistance protein [Desulfocicer vacuolatum]SMD03965.1 DnaJ like chaperone protein [Desulfocicer vacuolatum DSM 3385]